MAERIKTFNGVTLARLKTWNGVAEARIKSWNGVDNTATAGGPDVWYYVGGVTSFTSQTNSAWAPQTYPYGGPITVASAGTCTSLGANGSMLSGTGNIKLALFNSSYQLLGSGIVAVNTTTGWFDVTGLSIAVSAGTYYVFSIADSSSWGMRYSSAANSIYSSASSYASFPPSTITNEGSEPYTYGHRMYVD